MQEAVNIHLEYTRQGRREAVFSDLTQQELQSPCRADYYTPERRVFTVRWSRGRWQRLTYSGMLPALLPRSNIPLPQPYRPRRCRKSAYANFFKHCSFPPSRRTKMPGSAIPLKVLFLHIV